MHLAANFLEKPKLAHAFRCCGTTPMRRREISRREMRACAAVERQPLADGGIGF